MYSRLRVKHCRFRLYILLHNPFNLGREQHKHKCSTQVKGFLICSQCLYDLLSLSFLLSLSSYIYIHIPNSCYIYITYLYIYIYTYIETNYLTRTSQPASPAISTQTQPATQPSAVQSQCIWGSVSYPTGMTKVGGCRSDPHSSQTRCVVFLFFDGPQTSSTRNGKCNLGKQAAIPLRRWTRV